MTEIAIVDARLAHIRELVLGMRAADRREIEAFGLVPRHLLHALYRRSFVRRAGLIDGRLAAVWGAEGSLASSEIAAWMFTTAAVEDAPLTFFREAKKAVASLMDGRQRVFSHCVADYTQSTRFFAMLGFQIGSPQPMGAHGVLYREMSLERR